MTKPLFANTGYFHASAFGKKIGRSLLLFLLPRKSSVNKSATVVTSTSNIKKTSRFNKVLSCQSFGFLAIITLCWLNSLIGLPSLVLEGRFGASDFESPILQMLLILAVWLLVSSSTRRNLERLKHLENFMRVCAWCHRIDHNGAWKTPEKYFEEGFETTTTHGICHECLKRQTEIVEQTKRARKIETKELPTIEDLNGSTSSSQQCFCDYGLIHLPN
jgi:hypothetical protein